MTGHFLLLSEHWTQPRRTVGTRGPVLSYLRGTCQAQDATYQAGGLS